MDRHRHPSIFRILALCLLAVFVSSVTQSASAAPRTLRVVTDDNYPPYLFLGPNGQPEGYLVDLWKLWQAKTGVQVKLEPMQWAAAQRIMQEGKADVIDMIFRTPDRLRMYKFSKPYATQTVGIYVDHSIHGIIDHQSLHGFVIGVERGDACIPKLSSLGITHLITFPNYRAVIDAAKAGTIKIFCMDDDPANYYLYLFRDQLRFTKAFTLYEGHFHWAVGRHDSATYALVNRGMAMITPTDLQILKRKWLSHPIQFKSYGYIILPIILGTVSILTIAAIWILMLRKAVNARTLELQMQARELLKDQALLRTLLESSPDAMWLKDENGRYLECNASAIEMIGLPRDVVLGRKDADLQINPELAEKIKQADEQVLSTGSKQRTELQFTNVNGISCDVEVIKVPIRSADDEFIGFLGVGRDITERRRTERELRLAAIAFEGQDGMIVADAQGIIERVNAAFTRISGYRQADAVGKALAIICSGGQDPNVCSQILDELTISGGWSGEVINRRQNGELYTARLSLSRLNDTQGRPLHYIGALHDITAEKQAVEEAEYLKLFDPLTHLPNRTLLNDRIAHAQAISAEMQEYGALLMVDLDEFQRVNDAYGHNVGDDLLVEAARRIQYAVRDGDTIGRFNSDSFVVLTIGLGSDITQTVKSVIMLADKIRHVIAAPIQLGTQSVVCTASIGVTVFKDRNTDPGTLLRQAELAMQKGQRSGRNTVRLFEDKMQAEVEMRADLEVQLREAIEHQQFVLYYQPQVDYQGRLIGAEALVRWQHPRRGLIQPGEFIPQAEENGLIEPLGRWVLAQACHQLGAWASHSELRDLTLSVNVSVRQLRSPEFVDEVLGEVARFRLQPNRLKLEITESLAVDYVDGSVEKLRILRNAGIMLSIDDFGTANSSLAYLTKLPLNQLKIDKSFVDHLSRSHSDAMVVQTIIAMGCSLGLDVIAEGVETREQLELLTMQGCHAYQGNFFSEPIPISEFERRDIAGQWCH